jgi:hypothetical protein
MDLGGRIVVSVRAGDDVYLPTHVVSSLIVIMCI